MGKTDKNYIIQHYTFQIILDEKFIFLFVILAILSIFFFRNIIHSNFSFI